jgi:protease-4
MMRSYTLISLFILLTVAACAAPQVKLFSDATDPLQEFTIQGTAAGKILVISVQGIISTDPDEKFMHTMPSMVQEVVSQLKLAEADDEIKCVLLKVDTPGGTTTASDILYHEILTFKQKTGKKIVVVMMNIAASGGYYISLPADLIVAHPTTVTGSIGVIFMRPNVAELMDKIGLKMAVNKFGENKDMGSPFRPSNEKEREIFQEVTDGLGKRFLNLVERHRKLKAADLSEVSTARIYLAQEALKFGLIDKIGYLDDALNDAKQLAALPDDARVITYRRSEFPNDNLYNPLSQHSTRPSSALIDLGIADTLNPLKSGFYYLWNPATGM